MANGLARELREVRTAPATLSSRDVRSRKPLLLRMETARILLRVSSLLLLDAAGLFLGIWTALELKAVARGKSDLVLSYHQTVDVAPLAILVTILLFARSGLYGDRGVRPGFSRVVASLFQVTFVILIYAVAEGQHFSSYYIFYGSLIFAVFYITSFRWLFEEISGLVLRAAGYRRRAVLVGSGPHIQAVAQALAGGGTHPPVETVGFVSLKPIAENGLRDLGRLEEIERWFGQIDEVLIADPDFPQEEAVELTERCHRNGVRVRIAPSTMEILMDRVEFVPGQTLPLFELKAPVFEGVDFIVKRVFDLVASTFILVLLSPFLLLIAAAVKLTSRGPVIYRSLRPGIGGEPFACLKFRTMYEGAERRQAELEKHNEAGGALFKMRSDPRVTPVGRLLRRFSLDELPQLFNVLKGEMSLVGPRPLPQRDYDRLEDWHRKRYLVLPGVTGLWQVSGRSELDFDELVRLDFVYLENWSVFLDITIILKTIPAVFRAKGAW
jgi:exopolysaccharide biosynthesis polyprenyl glycosylphosphotransferase